MLAPNRQQIKRSQDLSQSLGYTRTITRRLRGFERKIGPPRSRRERWLAFPQVFRRRQRESFVTQLESTPFLDENFVSPRCRRGRGRAAPTVALLRHFLRCFPQESTHKDPLNSVEQQSRAAQKGPTREEGNWRRPERVPSLHDLLKPLFLLPNARQTLATAGQKHQRPSRVPHPSQSGRLNAQTTSSFLPPVEQQRRRLTLSPPQQGLQQLQFPQQDDPPSRPRTNANACRETTTPPLSTA